MNIATITFHWANNYGAVIQTYALQRFLSLNGFDSEVINYRPANLYFREIIRDHLRHDRNKIEKRKRISEFTRKEIRLSNRNYYFYNELPSQRYDCIICGSDQIWNEWLLHHESHLHPCLSYFLGFVGDGCKRISYAASFGTNHISDKTQDIIKPELMKYVGLSVREESAIKIIEQMGLCSERVCDPTLLLSKENYNQLLSNIPICENDIFAYILHNQDAEANQYVNEINDLMFNGLATVNRECVGGIYNWLSTIRDSRFVVTNSFHGTVFSILFHKEFIVLPVKGKDMNNRIETLLNDVGLKYRFCDDTDDISDIVSRSIDWDKVDYSVEQMSRKSSTWLLSMINN